MRFPKIDLCKIKKITAIEITTIFLAFIALGVYYSPKFMQKQEIMKAAKIKADNAVFASKVLEEFAQDKTAKPSVVAQKIADELNLIAKNPYDRKAKAYTFDINCKGCNSIEYDDNLSMVILTTYNKRGELIARTVIKPPSFVTYNKMDEKKK